MGWQVHRILITLLCTTSSLLCIGCHGVNRQRPPRQGAVVSVDSASSEAQRGQATGRQTHGDKRGTQSAVGKSSEPPMPPHKKPRLQEQSAPVETVSIDDAEVIFGDDDFGSGSPPDSAQPAGHGEDAAKLAGHTVQADAASASTATNDAKASQSPEAWWKSGSSSDRDAPDTETKTAAPGLAQRTADAVSDTVGIFIGSGDSVRGRILGVRESEVPPQSPDQELASASGHHQSDQVWEEHVLTLIDMLGAEVSGGLPADADARQRSEYVSQQVKLRLLHLIAGDPARAYEAIPGIAAAEQEFWQHTFFSLWKLLEERKQDGLSERERAAEALSYLNKAAQKLGAVAPLTIRTMAFCSEIESFGAYRVIPDSRFPAGERVLVYAEIENFTSEPLLASNGKFQTKLRSTLEIFPVSAQPRDSDPRLAAVAREELPTTVDLCARQRRDYFNAYTYTLPENLQPGYYKLQVTIVDELSGSVATESIPFEIAR
jgi:hypothetical protein